MDSSRKRKHNSHKSSREASSTSEDEETVRKRSRKEKIKRKKRKRPSSSSDADSSSSSSSSSEEERKHKHKREKKKKKPKVKKNKRDKRKDQKEETPVEAACSDVPLALMDKAKAMAPMTKEQWEKQQSVVRRVFDESTGRHRLIKGDGEVIEEIVSRDRHKAINKQATSGDGNFFHTTLFSKLTKK